MRGARDVYCKLELTVSYSVSIHCKVYIPVRYEKPWHGQQVFYSHRRRNRSLTNFMLTISLILFKLWSDLILFLFITFNTCISKKVISCKSAVSQREVKRYSSRKLIYNLCLLFSYLPLLLS